MLNPFFDSNSEVEVSSGRLPHWHQDGKMQYITFRLADSLPQHLIADIKSKADAFLNTCPQPWNKKTEKQYHSIIGALSDRLLDNGYGSCILTDITLRDTVSKSIMYFDKLRYTVVAYVVMPNHVHLILLLKEGQRLERIIQSIKRHSAASINKIRQKSGPVWMKQYFDRIIRSETHMHHCIDYIIENPRHLPNCSYTLYVHPDWQ